VKQDQFGHWRLSALIAVFLIEKDAHYKYLKIA